MHTLILNLEINYNKMLYDGATLFNDTIELFSGADVSERPPILTPDKVEALLEK